jgi:hypothetical protein
LLSEAFDLAFGVYEIDAGEGGRLLRLEPWTEGTILAFKDTAIHIMSGCNSGSTEPAAVTVALLERKHGLVAEQAVVRVGTGCVVFVGRRDSERDAERQGKAQLVDVPVSEAVGTLVRRINPATVGTSSRATWDNYAVFAVPLDEAVTAECDAGVRFVQSVLGGVLDWFGAGAAGSFRYSAEGLFAWEGSRLLRLLDGLYFDRDGGRYTYAGGTVETLVPGVTLPSGALKIVVETPFGRSIYNGGKPTAWFLDDSLGPSLYVSIGHSGDITTVTVACGDGNATVSGGVGTLGTAGWIYSFSGDAGVPVYGGLTNRLELAHDGTRLSEVLLNGKALSLYGFAVVGVAQSRPSSTYGIFGAAKCSGVSKFGVRAVTDVDWPFVMIASGTAFAVGVNGVLQLGGHGSWN